MRETIFSTSQKTDGRSPAAFCLWPLLSALEWPGEARHICEAYPTDDGVIDFDSLCETLANLNFKVTRADTRVEYLSTDDFPLLLLTESDDLWVIIEYSDQRNVQVFKGREAMVVNIDVSRLEGQLFLVRQKKLGGSIAEKQPLGWLGTVLKDEYGSVGLLFGVTFLINCLSLSLPLYLLTVFDLAIGARSSLTLLTLGGVIAILLASEIALREIRAQAIARVALRIQHRLIKSVFERILRLPLVYIENSSVAGQLNRLRTFEAVREIFSGPLASSLLDTPFIIVFVIAVFVIGGSLGWLLVIFIAAVLLLAAAFVPRARQKIKSAGIAKSETRIFRSDFTQHLTTIHQCGAEALWMQRYRGIIAHQLNEELTVQSMALNEQALTQAFSVVAGALVVGIGAVQVMSGDISGGSLIAIMAIVWRVLSPLQTVLLNINRMFQAFDTVTQINQLMKLPQESERDVRPSYAHVKGQISFEGVSYRNSRQSLPVLRGIDLKIESGKLIVLTGAPGPSRSTVLKLTANLNQPSSGRIRIDDCDIRQFDPRELRRRIAYVTNEQMIFSGTLAQNLRFANPLAEDCEIEKALIDADLIDFVQGSQDGLDMKLDHMLQHGLSPSICQKIRLARAYLQSPAIYLFDEPLKDVNPSGQAAFLKKLQVLKGQITVLVRTSDERIIRMADQNVFFHTGRIVNVPAEDSVGVSSLPKAQNLDFSVGNANR